MSAGFTPGPLPIVVRLNRRETSPSKHGGYSLINPDGPEAADTIEQLSAALDYVWSHVKLEDEVGAIVAAARRKARGDAE